MRKLLSVLLVLAVLLSVTTGCKNSARLSTTATTPPPAETTQTTQTTTVPTLPPSQEVVITQGQVEYTLTAEDVTVFETMLADFEILALRSEDPDEIDDALTQLEDAFSHLEDQASAAMVLYYCDLTDENASQRYIVCTELVTQANNDFLEVLRRIYKAEASACDVIFADWSELELQMLMAYTPEIMLLQQRNSEIEVAYQALQQDPELYSKMEPLFLELVQNNNRMAQIYGFDNYYQYAYQMGYDRDYGEGEVAAMRTYAATYLIPAMSGAVARFGQSISALDEADRVALTEFLYSAFDESTVEDYLKILPQQTGAQMRQMFDGDILLMDTRENALEGAFTTNLSSDRAICFFGPGCSDILTVIHEVGHYYGCQHTLLDDLPLDLAETQSQGNEWLFMEYLREQMDPQLYQALLDYKMYSDMSTIVISLIVDEFEQQVYTHPDPSSLTSSQLEEMMVSVCEKYGGVDYLAENLTDVHSYWRLVAIEQPVYYISYAVSAVAAMNIYTVAQKDFEEAVQIYANLIEELDVDKGFLGNLEEVGISGPFEEEVYKQLLTQ